MTSRILIHTALVGLCIATGTARAEVKLTEVIGDNAVLQRDMDVPVWGMADPNEEVTVTFAGQTKPTKADRFGQWRVELGPMPASAQGRRLTVKGPDNTIEVDNVMLGDVWLYLSQSFHMHTDGPQRAWEPPASKLPPIAFCRRSDLFEVRTHSNRPQAEFYSGDGNQARWATYEPPGKYFANYAFYLGVGLGQQTGVPVGVMGLGGTFLDAMTPPEGFKYYPAELRAEAEQVALWTPTTPAGRKAYLQTIDRLKDWVAQTRTTLRRDDVTYADLTAPPLLPGPPPFKRAPTSQYNNVIHRFMPAAVRGVVVQPREFDVGDPHYAARLRALIKGLRDVMHQADAPICVVQMHSADQYERQATEEHEQWMLLREAQAHMMDAEPNVSVVAAYDFDPQQRNAIPMELAMRVARWAVAVVKNEEVKTGPTLAGVRREGSKMVLTFDRVGDGLMVGLKEPNNPQINPAAGKEVTGFELAGADRTWHTARAVITGRDTVDVSSGKVGDPAHVRYAWKPLPHQANLYNRRGFAALPFSR